MPMPMPIPQTGQMQTGQLTQPDPNAGPGRPIAQTMPGMKKGGKVKKMASGGMTSKSSSASKRADGIAQRGKTKCKMY